MGEYLSQDPGRVEQAPLGGSPESQQLSVLITPLSPDSIRFEQAFSPDGGKTWAVNWIATDTRLKESLAAGPPPAY